MNYQQIIASALESLRMNAMRTALTMLGIIIGIGSVIMISSLGQGAVDFVNNELSAFGTNFFQITPGADLMSAFVGASEEPLTLEDALAIEAAQIDNVEAVAPIGWASRLITSYDQNTHALIYGVTESGQDMLQPEIVYGRLLNDTDDHRRVLVLGIDVAEDLFGDWVDPVGESVRIDGIRFRVIGVTQSNNVLVGEIFNSGVIMPLAVLSRDIRGDNELVEIDVAVANTDFINQTMEDVENFLRDRRGIAPDEESNFTMISFLESLDIINTITGLLTTFIAGVSSISLVVGGVGIMNIMLVSVTERTKEIGLLKSIGAKKSDIMKQFLVEAVTMSLIGGLVGIFFGLTGALVISFFIGIPFVISITWLLFGVVASSLVGIVFGLHPAKKAADLSPIDALRYE